MSEIQNVGIRGIEIYFPHRCLEMVALAEADGVPAGKYTAGLGQTRMAFCGDREDIISISLTVVKRLMEKCNIDPKDIGRLEVGTETIIDHSKSVKSSLMQLFTENPFIEGCDQINACYGGTNALFNALDWCRLHGGLAIVVAADIALYGEKNARPTGGAGAVAILVGPNAPIVMEGTRVAFSENVYDFYKPHLSEEYPVVDGHFSLQCYLRSLDACYTRFCAQNGHLVGASPITAASFDYFVFHSPYNKMVQKAFSRLFYLDRQRLRGTEHGPAVHPTLAPFDDMPLQETFTSKTLQEAATAVAAPFYATKVTPSTRLPTHTGNSYTASIYHSLASLLENAVGGPAALLGKRIVFFSYGSGSCAAMWMMRVRAPIDRLTSGLHIEDQIRAQQCTPFDTYMQAVHQREEALKRPVPWEPLEPMTDLLPGTFYLAAIDDKCRRTYGRVPPQ
eukprot:GAFH01001456.1.p1 GENE.GAFH01001456.1~~GAFH01001456.1.p1  ORF type:complete len:459 (-),score=151.07 GAFH01001456.1:241-1590(-)